MGTPRFAVASLERLYADGHDIAAVFTKSDKPRNRGMKLGASPVKETAMAYGSQVFQPESLTDGAAFDAIRDLKCDIVAVVAYGKILPRDILDLPPLGCINIHASLLPKYRGAAPIQWAIINGEGETGVTSMLISEELDAGDVFFSKRISIGSSETAGELSTRLSLLGADLLSETIGALSGGKAVRIPQVHNEASYAPSLKKENSLIDWSDTALNIERKVRGLNPKPAARADFGGTICKIFSVEISDAKHVSMKPGEVYSGGQRGLEVACADAIMIIKEMQAPGGKRMPSSEYFRGHAINDKYECRNEK